MNLIPKKNTNYWLDPFNEMENLQKEMNRLFNFSLGRPLTTDLTLSTSGWVPALDVIDEKDHIEVKTDLPGLKKEEIDVSIHDGILTIKGEKKQENEQKKDNYYKCERFYGSFSRSIKLPAEVDANKVEANYKDGVLDIKLIKKEESKPKQIKVDVK